MSMMPPPTCTEVCYHFQRQKKHNKHYVHDARPHLHRGLPPFPKTKKHNKHYVHDARPHLHSVYERLYSIPNDLKHLPSTNNTVHMDAF